MVRPAGFLFVVVGFFGVTIAQRFQSVQQDQDFQDDRLRPQRGQFQSSQQLTRPQSARFIQNQQDSQQKPQQVQQQGVLRRRPVAEQVGQSPVRQVRPLRPVFRQNQPVRQNTVSGPVVRQPVRQNTVRRPTVRQPVRQPVQQRIVNRPDVRQPIRQSVEQNIVSRRPAIRQPIRQSVQQNTVSRPAVRQSVRRQPVQQNAISGPVVRQPVQQNTVNRPTAAEIELARKTQMMLERQRLEKERMMRERQQEQQQEEPEDKPDNPNDGGRLLDLPVPDLCASRPKQWELNGHYYFYSANYPEWQNYTDDSGTIIGKKYDWLDARNECRQLCMDLVSMETPDETEMIFNNLTDVGIHYIWTSGRLCDFKGCNRSDLMPLNVKGWFWSATQRKLAPTNEIPEGWSFQPWSDTGHKKQPQPDNAEFDINQTTESCLGILNNIYKDGVKWHDIACYHQKPFICEDNDVLLKYVEATNPDIVL